MEFSDSAKWLALKDGKPFPCEEFRWIDLKAGGAANWSNAFNLLSEKLTTEEKGGWIKRDGGVGCVVLFISASPASDDYQCSLQKWLLTTRART